MQVDDSARFSEDTVDKSNTMVECDTTSSPNCPVKYHVILGL